jgi:hypothetical protein
MKRSLLILATLVGSVMAGCGGTEFEQGEESLAQGESALCAQSDSCAYLNMKDCTQPGLSRTCCVSESTAHGSCMCIASSRKWACNGP